MALTIAAVVPARAGSKRLPGKNTARLGDLTLIERAVECAHAVSAVNRVIVTTDVSEVLSTQRVDTVYLERNAALSTDTATMLDVLRDVARRLSDIDVIVLLQPTSPFRSPADVDRCVDLLLSDPICQCVTTVSPLGHPAEWLLRKDGESYDPLLGWEAMAKGSQDLPMTYTLNGAVYALRTEGLARENLLAPGTKFVEMPRERGLDIDTSLDFTVARAMMKALSGKDADDET